MKIARYLLQQLFISFFGIVQLDIILNPQMIELLFGENETTTKIPLQIQSQNAILYSIYKNNDNYFLKFAMNHIISNQVTVRYFGDTNLERNTNILFKMLTNGGDKFSKICCCYNHSLELNDIIIEVL
ncbi:unnamed protein product [Meloidogyne enterolobii]|uniref:Uncharacterized protein n=1 Tax=Meloidogyne enterolobii TaxID=390850 RepID=A0ACB0XV82_MELEN